MSHRPLLVSSLVALALMLGLARAAQAQEACGDTICPKGYECTTSTEPCLARPCVEGQECPPCEPTEYQSCTPLPCADDADCAEGMRCITQQHEECSGGETVPCAPPNENGGEPNCPEPTPPECTTVTESLCVPMYALPCEQASDCGESGFTCEVVEDCVCSSPGSSGSSGSATPAADAGAEKPAPSDVPEPADAGVEPTPPDDCTCAPTDQMACRVVTMACTKETESADCPSGWTCEQNPSGTCWVSVDGGSGCEPADPPMLCVPPYASLGGPGRGGVDQGSDSPTTPGSGEVSDGGTPPVAEGSGGSTQHAGAATPSSGGDKGGCSVGRAPGSPVVALFGFAFAALGLARRRRSTRTEIHRDRAG